MTQNKYLLDLFNYSKEFDLRLQQFKIKPNKQVIFAHFEKDLKKLIKDFYILDTKENKIDLLNLIIDRQTEVKTAPYAIHYGALSNPKHLHLETAKITIAIYNEIDKKTFEGIWQNIKQAKAKLANSKLSIPAKATGRTKGFSTIDDALTIYRIKEGTGLSIEEINKIDPLKIELENYSTLYYKIKKLIESQSLEN